METTRAEQARSVSETVKQCGNRRYTELEINIIDLLTLTTVHWSQRPQFEQTGL